jgi:hypothetical protein
MKECSTPFAIRKMQIKATLKFHLTPIRMAVIKNINNRAGGVTQVVTVPA